MPSRVRIIREIETKLRVNDVPALLGRIRTLGAVPSGCVFEQNFLYDTREADFRRRGQLLRLRIETPAPVSSVRSGLKVLNAGKSRATLTSKVPVPASRQSRFKEKLETEVVVSDPDRLQRALKKLGLIEGFRYEKYRTSFALGGTHLDLDETPVGDFLEIEGPRIAIDRIARRLGFTPRDYIRATYWDLYAADCRRKGRETGNMLFSA